jgi:hypothetical protein
MNTEYMIERMAYTRMRNELHVQYYEAAGATLEKYSPSALYIESQYEVFKAEFEKEVALLDRIMNSLLTPKIEMADHERDNILVGLRVTVNSAEHHFESTIRETATVIRRVLKRYGDIVNKSYDEETSAIDDLLRELATPECASAVNVLSLHTWIDQLNDANSRFKGLMQERDVESAQRPQTRMREIRKKVDAAFLQIALQVEALIRVNGMATYEPLINELNALTRRYKHTVAQEAGAKKKTEKEVES